MQSPALIEPQRILKLVLAIVQRLSGSFILPAVRPSVSPSLKESALPERSQIPPARAEASEEGEWKTLL